ncbi:MAG TPA: hypothetical protein VFH31_18910, partial [Pyrinomonadaceae bacterium]|nr:hypothetical protein [Pyrinomonadaceae bacterium]
MNLRNAGLLILLILSFFAVSGLWLFSPTVSGQAGVSVKSETARGLRQTTFSTPQGKIHVSLPEQVRAGATLTGRVYLEPSGRNEKEREKNLASLNGYVVDIEGGKGDIPFLRTVQHAFTITPPDTIIAREKFYSWTVSVPKGPIPREELAGLSLSKPLSVTPDIIIRNRTGKVIIRTDGPTIGFELNQQLSPSEQEIQRLEIASLRELERPLTPQDFQPLPRVGQEDRPIRFNGPFDGRIDNTSVTVGGRVAPILLEVNQGNNGSLFVQSPTDLVGQSEIALRERDVSTTGKFNNLRVEVTATETNILKGRTSLVTSRVTGFKGLDPEAYPISFEKVNRTPQIIFFEGAPGTLISNSITREEVGEEGIYTRQVTARGIQTGDFTIDVSVFQQNKCHCTDIKVDGQLEATFKYGDHASDFFENTPYLDDAGKPAGGEEIPKAPAVHVELTVPNATVALSGTGARTVTRSIYTGSFKEGLILIAFKIPADPNAKEEHKKKDWYRKQEGLRVDNENGACPQPIEFSKKTVEFILFQTGKNDQNEFVLTLFIDG